ncbi:MAG TPA: NFACT family protein [Pyrinomonadaceae bacterium]|nr:NFACT family protein [Pyrinomonadaceae bacterium]
MDIPTIAAVKNELDSVLVGRRVGKIFPLSKFDIAIDFRSGDSRFLFISVEPGDPRSYLIRRKLRDVEKSSTSPSPFHLLLHKRLSGAELISIEQIPEERVLFYNFIAANEVDEPTPYTVATQLTGRSANLFLLDSDRTIIAAIRETSGLGQQTGDKYEPPERKRIDDALHRDFDGASPSEILDLESLERADAKRFQSLVANARNKIRREVTKRTTLVKKLNDDLAGHGDPERWKRFGDLLLANTGTARRDGTQIFVTDYFDEHVPEIAIEVEPNESPTEAAERYFKRYTKSRNAQREIDTRIRDIERELGRFESESERLEEAIDARDEETISSFAGSAKQTAKKRGAKEESVSGVRSFVSSDGFEILVGKKARDNDFLTFRVARSLDTWMHAADYPGSHVVIRNPNRREVPQKTLLEAAQLAAFYSQGKTQPKAAVHYTQKKFVNKPRGAAPGLVSLASFKTILVEPIVGDAKLKTS